MKKHFISAAAAHQHAQTFNRNAWVEHTLAVLNSKIEDAAKLGLHHVDLCLHTIIIGAENLGEAGEMCTLLQKELKSFGYTTKITPDGQFSINW